MRSVLITGTSAGFGRLAAVELARRGWRVFATMRDLSRKGALETAVSEAGVADRVDIRHLDVTDKASVGAAAAAVLAATGGRLDAVVHNAGIAIGGAFEDVPDADARRVMETNFFGVLELTRALLPALRAQRRGRILVVSSDAAFMGEPANAIYCASKWAVEGWAEAVAYELSHFGIEIVLVEPGPFATDIWQAPRALPPASPYRAWVQFVFRAGDAHLAKQGGDPAVVARAIANVLEARRPRFRTPVGSFAWLAHFLRGKIPNRVFRWGIERYLGLGRLRP
jgi:NAD(P)-dependent dehydrogenase (short-subunit alcohol dehydrogenase family)